MSDWLQRPQIEATLLNPALIALTLAHSANAYVDRANAPMQWPVAFLVPPLVLHKPTRDALPRDVRTHFSKWVADHPLLVVGFSRRARAMTEPTREALRVGVRSGQLVINEQNLVATSLAAPPAGELAQLLRASALVGRWLGTLREPSTAFALLGVVP